MYPTYRVVWEIDIDADTPLAAARKALEIQQRPDSTATVFTVINPDEPGNADTIDLMDYHDEARE